MSQQGRGYRSIAALRRAAIALAREELKAKGADLSPASIASPFRDPTLGEDEPDVQAYDAIWFRIGRELRKDTDDVLARAEDLRLRFTKVAALVGTGPHATFARHNAEVIKKMLVELRAAAVGWPDDEENKPLPDFVRRAEVNGWVLGLATAACTPRVLAAAALVCLPRYTPSIKKSALLRTSPATVLRFIADRVRRYQREARKNAPLRRDPYEVLSPLFGFGVK